MSAATECERLEPLVSNRTRALQRSTEMYRLIAESTKAIPFILDVTQGRFTHIGPRAVAAFGFPEFQWKEPDALDLIFPRRSNPEIRARLDECESGSFECLTPMVYVDGRRAEVCWTGTCECAGHAKILRGFMLDITEVRRRGLEVVASQKLESVGRLAAEIAHEPIGTGAAPVYNRVAA